MTETEALKKEIDTSGNEKLETQEMEEFLKSEENIKKLGEVMNSNSSPELLQELENTLKDLCDKILSQAEISENQQKILDYFINKFGDKYPETKTKIENRSGKETDKGEDNDQKGEGNDQKGESNDQKGESNNQEGESNDQKGGDNNQEGEDNGQEGEENEIINKDGEINLKSLEDEISSAVETLFNDPVHNLEYLGINKKTLFNWKNLLNDIKTVEDVEKINESTITKYLKISPDIPKENYAYIANNVKIIIKRHLEVNPKYQSILGGQSSHMTIETTVKNNEYLANLYNNVKSFIENPKNNVTVQIDNIVGKINKGDQNSLQFVNLWLNMYLGDKKGTEQNKIVEKIFDKFPSTNPENFLNACNNDEALGNLKDSYIQYRLQKENVLFGTKDENGADAFILDMTKKNKFEKFKGKGGKITKEYDFDKAYKYTQDFYAGLKGLKIDESIPLNNIINFLIFRSTKQEENTNLSKIASEKIRKDRDMVDNNPFLGYGGHVTANNAGFNEEKKIKNNCITIEEKYAALLLKSKNRPKGKIQGISGSNLTLDFSKGNNPKDIVRDNLGEKLSDSWNEFKYNISYDRKAAVGGAAGMIAGILASGASCVSGNIWAAAGAFTLTSRGVNGAAQEALNGIQYAVESISGEKATGGNQVNNLGDSFMKGIGAYEPVVDKDGQPILDENGKIQYQFIGWDRFTSNLAFDYLGGVAMFGAFKALGPSFEAIKSVKIAGKPLEFASKWLFVQNFGIDMPMNALHKGTDVFLGIGDKQQKYHGSFLYGHNNGGEDAEGNEYYKSGNIGDAFEAMLGNMEEHMSLNNQSQVLFNTLLYCGMLEAGQGLASKMKSYMPATRIEKYETSSKKFQEAQKDFVSEISKKGLKLNEKFELVNAKTGKKIGALEFLEFKLPLLKLKGVLAEHTKATQELVASEKELSGDGSKTYGLLKEMGLLSDKQPPLNILKEKIIEAKKQYQKAIEAGDLRKAQELKEIILDHQSAQITLISEFHPDAINNINLSSEERIQKAKELLQSELTAEQEQAILDAHNAPGDAYSLSIPELRAKSKILFKAGFTEAQVRTLIENCICGKMKGTGEIKSERIGEGTREKVTQQLSGKATTGYNKAMETLGSDEGLTEIEKTKYDTKKEQYQKIKEYCTKTDFMSEHDLYKIFNERISVCKSEGEIKEFLVKRNATLEYFSGNEVRFRDPKTKEIVEGKNIFDYGKSLFGDKFQTPECQKLRKVMEEFMFNQSLDNPLQYNSHGFDHSILVDAYSQMVIDKESIRVVSEKYGISSEGAEVLLRLSAVFHDFGYPEIVKVDEKGNVTLKMDKSMHGLEGGLLFENEIAPAFRDVMKLYGAEGTKLDQAVIDMRDAISYHSADKIEEPPYKFKLHTEKGEILINEKLNDECVKWLKDSYCKDSDIVEIHTQDGAFNENSPAFKELKSKLESQGIKVNEKCIIDEPTNRYTTSVEVEGTVNQYYRGRKGHDAEGWPIGIEIQPIDLYDSPLASVVRFADNMDMAFNRLSEVQKNPVFMDLMYNLGMDAVWDGKGNPPASKIFQEMEGLKNAAKKVGEGELTPEEFKTKIDEFLSKYGEITTLELFTYDAKTGTRNPDLSGTMEFNSDWKADIEGLKSKEVSSLEKEALKIVNKFKESLVTKLNDLEYPEGGPRGKNQYFDVIKGVSQEKKTGSYSLRHVAGLTCIEDVCIDNGNFMVTLDPKVYYDSALSRQTVREKGESNPINVNDYHIWRLFDASSKVTIDGQVSNIMMTDTQGNLMGVITRCSENGKFKPYYALMDGNGNIVKNAQGKAIFVDKFSDAQTYYQLSIMETSADFSPKDRQDMLNAIIKEGKTFAELQEIHKDIKGLKEGDNIDNYKDDSRLLDRNAGESLGGLK